MSKNELDLIRRLDIYSAKYENHGGITAEAADTLARLIADRDAARKDTDGCWLCKNEGKNFMSLELSDIFIATPARYTYIGDGQEYDAPLSYCPACGRKLPEKRKKE